MALLRALSGVLLVLLTLALADAREFYVDAVKGDDARTEQDAQRAETPWATPARAAKAVQPGDTVLVQAGVYPPFAVTASGTADKPIIFQAVGNAVISNTRELPTTMTPVAGQNGIWSIDDPGPVTTIFEDVSTTTLIVENYGVQPSLDTLAKAGGGPAFFFDAAAKKLYLKPFTPPVDPAKKRLVVSRTTLAIYLSGSYITVDGFRIEYAQVGARLEGSNNIVRHLTIYQCVNGVNLVEKGQTCEGCTIYACGGGFGLDGNVTVRNNTLNGSRAWGMWLGRNISGTIVNNVLIGGGVSGGCLYAENGLPAGLTMDHNLWMKYTNRRGRISMLLNNGKNAGKLADLQALGFELRGLQEEPLFVNLTPGKLDLRPQTRADGFAVDSPLINGGTPDGMDIGALQAPTMPPTALSAQKTDKGVRLQWEMAWLTDSYLGGYVVYRRDAAGGFTRVTIIADPAVRAWLDPAGKPGCAYHLTSLRPGLAVEGAPSADVIVK